jgi:hypothetical protein
MTLLRHAVRTMRRLDPAVASAALFLRSELRDRIAVRTDGGNSSWSVRAG